MTKCVKDWSEVTVWEVPTSHWKTLSGKQRKYFWPRRIETCFGFSLEKHNVLKHILINVFISVKCHVFIRYISLEVFSLILLPMQCWGLWKIDWCFSAVQFALPSSDHLHTSFLTMTGCHWTLRCHASGYRAQVLGCTSLSLDHGDCLVLNYCISYFVWE